MAINFDRAFVEKHVTSEIKKNNFDVPGEAIPTIIDLVLHFGNELYRPITRLLCGNWKPLAERVAHYTPEQWDMVDSIKNATPRLDRKAIAILLEVLEGDDTPYQDPEYGKQLTEEELKKIRQANEAAENE